MDALTECFDHCETIAAHANADLEAGEPMNIVLDEIKEKIFRSKWLRNPVLGAQIETPSHTPFMIMLEEIMQYL